MISLKYTLEEEAVFIEERLTEYIRKRTNAARSRLNVQQRDYTGVTNGGLSISGYDRQSA